MFDLLSPKAGFLIVAANEVRGCVVAVCGFERIQVGDFTLSIYDVAALLILAVPVAFMIRRAMVRRARIARRFAAIRDAA